MVGLDCRRTEALAGMQVLPILRPFLGRGKLGNWLIRNKWRNYEAVQRLGHVPILMLSAGQVRHPEA